MQIIIPMSGFGERFKAAGYRMPKPLICVEGKPIIAHVIDMFPEENDFIFICNQDHLDNTTYNMAETILQYCPSAKIFGIKPHKKGPVYAVLQIQNYIDLNKPTIINYCDFTCYWDWKHFCNYVKVSNCDGAIPAYKGFHPHSLGNTNYAYLKEKDGKVFAIQEKQPYTDNRMQEFASSGTYYYATGELMLHAFNACVQKNLHLNGEFYVSLTYNILLEHGKDIRVYELQHFMQWGTPEDLVEYQTWSEIFKNITQIKQKYLTGAIVIPMAGLGARFIKDGYQVSKPLIKVSGNHMVIQTSNFLFKPDSYSYILRNNMVGAIDVQNLLVNSSTNVSCTMIDEVTDGQATTAKIGLDKIKDDNIPITFSACDNGVIFDHEKLVKILNDQNIDVIVWGIRGYHSAIHKPHMYGWIDVDDNQLIKQVSVKVPLKDIKNDPIIIGTFTFKNKQIFIDAYNRMKDRNGRVNNEFYIDECINDAITLGYKCYLFECDAFISWGTPNELKTFEYWQSCFSKWISHPYILQNDNFIPRDSVNELIYKYRKILPNKFGYLDVKA